MQSQSIPCEQCSVLFTPKSHGQRFCSASCARSSQRIPFDARPACAIPGCERVSFCRDLCAMHYQRQRTKGTTGSAAAKFIRVSGTLQERFSAHVDCDGPLKRAAFGQCWPWTGYSGADGAGRFVAEEHKRPLAYRVAWEIASGAPVPDGMEVLHVCDFRLCVRNDQPGIYVVGKKQLPRWGHLFLGTQLDNMLDCRDKGRSYVAKLSVAQIADIRLRLADGEGVTVLSRLFGVNRHTISAIHTGRTWR